MIFSQTSVLAAMCLSAVAQAHMIMKSPVPFGDGLNNSPLDASGSDFPCKQRGAATYNDVDTSGKAIDNTFAPGSSQTLSFIGQATHGGGSCQLSVTTDADPSKSSSWKVIHSIEGGCPTSQPGNLGGDPNGGGSSVFNFTVPTELAGGKYTLAWTWFNHVGNREMYMNCAPITVTGGSSKRDQRNQKRAATSYLASLPDMFTANIGNGCTTIANADLLFPNPGSSLEKVSGVAGPLVAASGTCQTASGGSGAAASGAASSAAAPAPSNSGGVFAPGAAQGTGTAASASVPASSAPAAVPTSSAAAAAPAPAASSAAAPAPAASSAAASPPSGGATTCSASQAGQMICSPDGSQYALCDPNRSTLQWMSMATGTVCKGGVVAAAKLRFSRSHVHRRHHNLV